jgi:hypothetical protein
MLVSSGFGETQRQVGSRGSAPRPTIKIDLNSSLNALACVLALTYSQAKIHRQA